MEKLLEVMRQLRGPQGCPWDREQTHRSLRPYLLEEAAEAVDALSAGQVQPVVEELGDVLLQIAFHSVIAEEEGSFDYRAVEQAIVDKLVRRHPHVFGEVEVSSAAEVVSNWQAIKAAEGKQGDLVARSLPALARASQIQRKLGHPAGSVEQVRQSLERDDLGEVLWQVVALCRARQLDAEVLLREICDSKL